MRDHEIAGVGGSTSGHCHGRCLRAELQIHVKHIVSISEAARCFGVRVQSAVQHRRCTRRWRCAHGRRHSGDSSSRSPVVGSGSRPGGGRGFTRNMEWSASRGRTSGDAFALIITVPGPRDRCVQFWRSPFRPSSRIDFAQVPVSLPHVPSPLLHVRERRDETGIDVSRETSRLHGLSPAASSADGFDAGPVHRHGSYRQLAKHHSSRRQHRENGCT